ncbi:NUDIX hydrolase [Bifidobacterium eulemuris]|uniref:ADP-ribose pyrophosphatase n=1 Tax=Bifidobacterium eulemuris TaxID=1765219 RepID=A0A261G7M8_9BIFI|nr:NUDIX domain-containing protein [Bifidobacterium eulemuris]OZG67430.1 ADP-ribose pyrophosphatase [Bifidobacterium eulemuris]QOL32998.1 NUDIX hydrolase [Bifidobacterium eulemuris]
MGIGNVTERRTQSPRVGVSVVILVLGPGSDAASHHRLWLPLVRRTRQPYQGMWALPGEDLRADETLEHAACKALESTTALAPRYLEQLRAFGGPLRSQGGLPMVSVVYWAMVGRSGTFETDRVDNVRWFAEDELPELAFDHRQIVDYALRRLRTTIEYPDVVARLVGPTFTLRQLHGVVEAIAGQSVDLANFRRRILASGELEDTGEKISEGRQRPAAVYRYAPRAERDAAAWTRGLFGDELHRINQELRLRRESDARAFDDPLSALVPHRG